MRKDKKKIIVAIVSISVILSILIIGAILFFTTDFLKSDQQLFFKYLAKNVEVIEQYFEDPNKSTIQQIESAPYTVNSSVNFDLVSSNSEIANQTTPPRNFSITYTKNADPQNNRDYSQAKIKYLTKELFTAKYAHDGDYHVVNGVNEINGSDVFNIYLGIENKNLKQLAQKLGIQDVSNIPNKIENISLTQLFTLTNTEKEYLQSLLTKVITSQVPKNKFYHNKDVTIEIDTKPVKANAYGIALTSQEYQNLMINILNTISQDENVLNILLQKIILIDSETQITINDLKTQIQNIINKINTNGFSEGIKLEVYEANGELVRTKIEKNAIQYYIADYERTNNSIRTLISLNYTYSNKQANIEQQPNSDVVTDDDYQIIQGSATEQPIVEEEIKTVTIKNIEFAKQLKGNQNNMIMILTYETGNSLIKISLQNKTEQNNTQNGIVKNIILNINDTETTYFTIKLNSNITSSNSVTVEEINETNSAVLNNRTPENILQLLNAIKVQLQKIYDQQMQVAKEVQQQEDSQNGLTPVDPNAAEANQITNRNDIVE